MKYFKTLAILFFSSVLFFYGCNDSTKQDTTKSSTAIESPTQSKTESPKSTTPTPTTKEPAQNTGGVWHYTCAKGCAGGAGSAVNCSNCGTLLAHNAAYHSKAKTTPTSSAPFATPTASTTPTRKAEPSQNTAGVWHYTCKKGCAGGAGSAVACGTCGDALAHNSAYHQ